MELEDIPIRLVHNHLKCEMYTMLTSFFSRSSVKCWTGVTFSKPDSPIASRREKPLNSVLPSRGEMYQEVPGCWPSHHRFLITSKEKKRMETNKKIHIYPLSHKKCSLNLLVDKKTEEKIASWKTLSITVVPIREALLFFSNPKKPSVPYVISWEKNGRKKRRQKSVSGFKAVCVC